MKIASRLLKENPSVLLVAEPLRAGGLTGFARTLFRGISQAGLRPYMAAAGPAPVGFFASEEEARIECFPGMLGGLTRPFVFGRLADWAAEIQPALIHGLSAFTQPVCARLAERLNVPYVLSIPHFQARGDIRVDDRLNKVMVCNESLRENLVNDARVPKELVRVVPLGIEIPEEVPPQAKGDGQWAMLATFAPLTPGQDLATFIRAAQKVHEVRCGACQFLIVGEGPEESSLRKLARELKLERHLTFAHAGVPYEPILRDLDVYVQTPRQEAFGLGALAAMAWARPVVATSVGGLIGLVQDGQSGYLVPPGQPDAVAAKILDLLGDAKLRARMGQRGRDQAQAKYDLEPMIDRTLQQYAEAQGFVTASPSGSGITRLFSKG